MKHSYLNQILPLNNYWMFLLCALCFCHCLCFRLTALSIMNKITFFMRVLAQLAF